MVKIMNKMCAFVVFLLVLAQLSVISMNVYGDGQRGTPDLMLTTNDIWFSKSKPLKGEIVQINATVHNVGSANATNVRVRFYDGDPSTGTQIGTDQILPKVPKNGKAIARINWSTTGVQNGTHYIYVVIDPTNSISEINETNNTANRSIFVNLRPVAIGNASVHTEYTLTWITFSANSSYDPDGFVKTYLWDFDDGNTSKGIEVKHAFGDDGIYNVTLLVTDNMGGVDSTIIRVNITNRPPIAIAYDVTQKTKTLVTLDAQNSTDYDGYIANAMWRLHNGTILRGIKVTTIYDDDGLFPVNLTVIDDDGAKNYTTFFVNILNQPPVAIINASSTKINRSETVTFDASKSYDVDGYISNYTWIYPGGMKEYGKKTTHKFNVENGSYRVRLVCIDDDGDIGNTTVMIRVGNLAPKAIAGLDKTAYTWENLTFDGTNSYDPDGKIVNYTWNFMDGNISHDSFTMHSFADDGIYKVTLTVTDNDGMTDTATINVTVYNQAPKAYFPDIETETYVNVTFNGTYCSDVDGYIANYTWNFGDGTISYSPQPTHMWKSQGIYKVKLTVRDDDGAKSSHIFNVTVKNHPPIASFYYLPSNPTEGDIITFNASGSVDLDGEITNYTWNFGDGEMSHEPVVNHSYEFAGNYTVVLIVTDNNGASDTMVKNITVLKRNYPPVATFDYNPKDDIDTATRIFFNASASYDPDGKIILYTWSWGDGNETNTHAKTYIYTYKSPGQYTITLTVMDNGGKVNSTSVSIIVKSAPKQSPIAIMSYPNKTYYVGDEITFTGFESFDPDGFIVNYSWDMGDGTKKYGDVITHVYNIAKKYLVKLTVRDNDGMTCSTTAEITISERPPPIVPPIAVVNANPSTAEPGDLITFDGTKSKDEDGNIVEYIWDFGDGTSSKGNKVTHRYTNPGVYDVYLTVVDDDGATGIGTVTIQIKSPPQPTPNNNTTKPKPNKLPVANITATNLEAYVGDYLRFYGEKSYDEDGVIVGYLWEFGDGNKSTRMNPMHSYESPGTYTLTLTVYDDRNGFNSTSVTITIKEFEEEVEPPKPPKPSEKTSGFEAVVLMISVLFIIGIMRREK